jgi:hypothetical protein
MGSNSVAKKQQDLTLETNNSEKKHTLIIGQDELTNVFVSNKLQSLFPQSINTKNNIEEALHYFTEHSVDLVVFDIDNISNDAIERIYKLINHFEVPCLMTGSDPGFLNKLRVELDQSFLSFLPKPILRSMFTETMTLLLNKCGTTKKVAKRILATGHLPKTKTLFLLATLLFCEPLLKVLYLKFQTGFEWDILMRTIFSIEGAFKNFEFWGIFPLAGYALISVRTWSFLFFMGLQAYSIYAYLAYEQFTWPYVAQSPHVSTSLLLICNLSIIMYFMVPAHFRPFWNETRKIWRNTTRFATTTQAFFKHKDKNINTTITNISETGAYFTSTQELGVGERISLEIPINGEIKKIEATIRRTQATAHEDYTGYGVEFHYKSSQDKKDLKEYVNSLNLRIQ